MKEKNAKETGCPGLTFPQLVQFIKKSDVLLSRKEIEKLLVGLNCQSPDYREFIGFAEPYNRRSVVKSEFDCAELFVMTWHPNQQSVIHDHFQSACGIRVLQGEMTETLYEVVKDDKVRQINVAKWSAGKITTSEASFDIHKISNQADEVLVTLHIYSMPLDPNKMRRFMEVD